MFDEGNIYKHSNIVHIYNYIKLSQGGHCAENIILEMCNPSCGENDTQQWNNPTS